MADTEPKKEDDDKTTEPTEGKEQAPVASDAAEPEAEPEEPRIPKARLDAEIRKRRELEQKLAELQGSGKPRQKDSGDGPDKKAESELLARLAAIEERDAIRDLRADFGLNADQAKVVHGILKQNPGLEQQEALAIARGRDPETFGEKDARGFDPSQHASVRPAGSGPPPQKTLKDRVKEIKEIDAEPLRHREASRLHGQMVARALGWERKD